MLQKGVYVVAKCKKCKKYKMIERLNRKDLNEYICLECSKKND